MVFAETLALGTKKAACCVVVENREVRFGVGQQLTPANYQLTGSLSARGIDDVLRHRSTITVLESPRLPRCHPSVCVHLLTELTTFNMAVNLLTPEATTRLHRARASRPVVSLFIVEAK